jgi:hypothetical protein
MRYTKWFAGLALAIGMGFAGAPALSAAQPYGYRQEVRSDYSRIARLRDEIAADRARLNDDIRHGRQWAVRRDREELQRDQHALDALLRNNNRYDRDTAYGFRPR